MNKPLNHFTLLTKSTEVSLCAVVVVPYNSVVNDIDCVGD